MTTALTSKQENEQAAFAKFARYMGIENVWLSVSSRPEPEPDLLCVHASDGPIAFELVSLLLPKCRQQGQKPAKIPSLLLTPQRESSAISSARNTQHLQNVSSYSFTPMAKSLHQTTQSSQPFIRGLKQLHIHSLVYGLWGNVQLATYGAQRTKGSASIYFLELSFRLK